MQKKICEHLGIISPDTTEFSENRNHVTVPSNPNSTLAPSVSAQQQQRHTQLQAEQLNCIEADQGEENIWLSGMLHYSPNYYEETGDDDSSSRNKRKPVFVKLLVEQSSSSSPEDETILLLIVNANKGKKNSIDDDDDIGCSSSTAAPNYWISPSASRSMDDSSFHPRRQSATVELRQQIQCLSLSFQKSSSTQKTKSDCVLSADGKNHQLIYELQEEGGGAHRLCLEDQKAFDDFMEILRASFARSQSCSGTTEDDSFGACYVCSVDVCCVSNMFSCTFMYLCTRWILQYPKIPLSSSTYLLILEYNVN